MKFDFQLPNANILIEIPDQDTSSIHNETHTVSFPVPPIPDAPEILPAPKEEQQVTISAGAGALEVLRAYENNDPKDPYRIVDFRPVKVGDYFLRRDLTVTGPAKSGWQALGSKRLIVKTR